MLRNFLYLDTHQLDQYVSQVEDGLRQKVSRLDGSGSATAGGASLKVVTGSKESTKNEQSETEFADTASARFERLTSLVSGHEDQFGWVEVLQDSDLEGVRPGNLIDVSAEIYQPEVASLIGAKGLISMLPLAKAMSALSPEGGGIKNMPNPDQLDAMAQFGAAMPDGILQGDVLDSDWTVVGTLTASGNPREIEGDARIVGKVTRVWGEGAWKPLPGLPILSSMPRKQKREYEQKGPDEKSKMMWVEGPAIQLDILAIYR